MRYPFRHAVDRYIREYSGVLSVETIKMRVRAYRRITGYVEYLHSHGRISTQDPHDFTVHDVREFVMFERLRGISPSTLENEISYLQNILMFCDNDSVRFFKVRYPAAVPIQKKGGEPIMDPEEYDRLVEIMDSIVDPADLRRWIPTAIALGTGARLNEFRNMRVEDFDLSSRSVRISYPKGFESWGRVRVVPIRPEFLPAIIRWLDFVGSGYILPRPYDGVPISRNTLEKYRRGICGLMGIAYDYRMCRRTYGQRMIDEGVPLSVVSVILGHSRVDTTTTFYARVRNETAVGEVVSRWYKVEDLPEPASEKYSGAEEGI